MLTPIDTQLRNAKHLPVPEENRDLAILRKFSLFAQNRNFSQILPRRAIFAQI